MEVIVVTFVFLWLVIPTASRNAGFSTALRCALLIPATVTAGSFALLATRILEPRSPLILPLVAAMILATLMELVAVRVATWRLISNDETRTTRNVVSTSFGALCMLPWIAVYMNVK